MKLETSQDLLARLRARHKSSWYGLAPLLGAHVNTVANWENGRTVIDRKFAMRVAELLEEPPEYVLACLELEREQDAGARKLWRSIAAKFRATAASILLLALGGALLSAPEKTSAGELVGPRSDAGSLYILLNRTRRGDDRGRCNRLLGRTITRTLPWLRRMLSAACRPSGWRALPAVT